MFKGKITGNEVGEKCVYNAACFPSFCTAFSQAFKLIHFGDVSEPNEWETLTSPLGTREPKRVGRAE